MTSPLLALWRRLPAPIRQSAHLAKGAPKAAFLAGQAWLDDFARTQAARAAEARTLRRVRRRNRRPSLPITVVGFHGAVHGLGEGARMLARGFADAGLPVRAVDLSAFVGMPVDLPTAYPPPGPRERGVVISHINPPELLRWARETEGQLLGGRRHIGYWAWELEDAPAAWAPAFDLVDEVWTPSAFAADALRKIAPPRVKVTPLPYPLYLNPRPAPDRARFGLPAETVVVLMAFDLRSTAQRKNPYGALRAFRMATRDTARPALLVCKVVGADLYPDTFAALAADVASDPTIRLMRESLSAEDMAALTASSDIILSLHRSEGYGLLLAEAIWLGKPTLATGWSSNVEFMDPASSQLVDYDLIPVEGDGAIYQSGRWAAADEDDAARKLARMIDDDAWLKTLAAATAANGHVSFDRPAWLNALRRLLPLR
ncbi:glycosyl transferase family 1 [Caulobacter segnis]|uniref:Glycosyl transferase group 1 n=2 Tax=Caulobacter segnis TaxID=88688 RepID=D5VMH1_CAUST|nr:glycosyltransferase [Caulobacter segnis]ADG11694.1 glycosyl transferase group 1 [Caulobacter segnis ATCC 21756]AVQ03338.1 glycosyl transferase family 1 [Caulobacter segnis]